MAVTLKAGTPKLKDVKEPASLRDYILTEWVEFRKKKYPQAPADLYCTSSVGDGNDTPSHSRGAAIDIVTDGWAERRYLIPFGLWLRRRNSAVNVIFYSKKYMPHVHVAVWSGFTGRSDNSLAVNLDASQKYKVYQPSEIAAKAKEIRAKLEYVASTYPEGVKIDFDKIEAELQGTPDIQEALKPETGFKELLRKYWWIGAISVGLLLLVVIFKKIKGAEYG